MVLLNPLLPLRQSVKSTKGIGILYRGLITKDESHFFMYEHLHGYFVFLRVVSRRNSWTDLEKFLVS